MKNLLRDVSLQQGPYDAYHCALKVGNAISQDKISRESGAKHVEQALKKKAPGKLDQNKSYKDYVLAQNSPNKRQKKWTDIQTRRPDDMTRTDEQPDLHNTLS